MGAATRLPKVKGQCLTLEEVLRGVPNEAPKYVDLDEVLELLSLKGTRNSQQLMAFYDELTSSSEDDTDELRAERRMNKVKSLQQLRRAKQREMKKRRPTTRIK
jgi:hypothetical protein